MPPKPASLAGTIVLVAAVATLLVRHALLATPAAAYPLALGLQGAAVVLMLWARWTFGRRSFHAAADPTAGGLVTTGPYRFVRHPIYAAVLLFVWAGVLAHASPPVLALAALATAATGVRVWAEEQLVAARYPAYAAYAARTRRLVPFVL